MVDIKAPMAKRRMEEIALILLELLVKLATGEVGDPDLPKGVTADELLEFATILAPELMAQIMSEVDAKWNPLEELDEILHGISERIKADSALPKRGSTCSACESGKLEFPVEDGIYILSADLSCPNCGVSFPSH